MTEEGWVHADAGLYPGLGGLPQLAAGCRVFPGARLVGGVTAGPGCSFWYNCVVRGDLQPVRLGELCNVQDQCVLHVTRRHPVVLGDLVTLGHGAVLHGCTVGDGVLVGMQATVLDGAVLGPGCLVAAGALVPEGMVVPPGSLVAGLPARVVRTLDPAEQAALLDQARRYGDYAREAWELLLGGFGSGTAASRGDR